MIAILSVSDNDENFFENFLMPLTRKMLDAEDAHKLAVFACKWNLLPRISYEDPMTLVSFSYTEPNKLDI